MKLWRAAASLVLAWCGGAAGRAEEPVLLVSAAASLRTVLQACAAEYPAAKLTFNFGGSGALAAQLLNGAAVDVFIAAGENPMARVVEAGLVDGGEVRRFLGNRLVLIAPRRVERTGVDGWEDLRGEKVRHLAIGEPRSVPAGEYAAETLRHLELWDSMKGRLVYAKDVRQVLAYVERGEAEAGLVYATDAADSDAVRVVAPAPEGAHSPIRYPLAVPLAAPNREAALAFAAWLEGAGARAIFLRSGFLVTEGEGK